MRAPAARESWQSGALVGRAWSVRVARCWLWQALGRWGAVALLPTAPQPARVGASSQDAAQWRDDDGVAAATRAVVRECAGSDHWPPELLAASAPLPRSYARQLADDMDDPRLPHHVAPVRAGSCFATPTHFCVHLVGDRGRLRYSVDTGRGAVPAVDLHLTRLVEYTFQMVGVADAHPFLLSTSDTGPGRRYATGVRGTHPAARYEFFVFTPGFDAPTRLWYQSASRSGVGGAIHIHHTSDPEPSSLLELLGCADGIGRALGCADASLSPTPSALYVWDENGARRHPLRTGGDGGGHGRALGADGHHAQELPLAEITETVLRRINDEQYEAVLAAAMARAPPGRQRHQRHQHVQRHPEHHGGMDRVGGDAAAQADDLDRRDERARRAALARDARGALVDGVGRSVRRHPRRARGGRCGAAADEDARGSITTKPTRPGWVSKRSASLRRCG